MGHIICHCATTAADRVKRRDVTAGNGIVFQFPPVALRARRCFNATDIQRYHAAAFAYLHNAGYRRPWSVDRPCLHEFAPRPAHDRKPPRQQFPRSQEYPNNASLLRSPARALATLRTQ